MTELRQKEDELNLIEEKAKQKWTEEVCEKVSNADTHSEMWQHFRKLTSYHDEDGVGVLPLLDEHNTAVFDKEGKTEILKNTFFAGAHLKDIPFDEMFKEEMGRDVLHMKNGSVSSNDDWGRDMEFLNGNISLEEVQAVLQMQRVGIAPGPDEIYSDLLLHAGKQLQSVIHLIYSKSWQEGVIPEDRKQAEVKFLKKVW